MKTNLLEFFYEHIEENDWLEGLDLYQAGKVTGLQDYGGLITAKIGSNYRGDAEVRLKIHPSGRVVQWIECTCRKNRSTGQYCEHMAAFMITIDREKAKLLNSLDSKMPLKAPSGSKKSKASKNKYTEETKDNTGAAQTILSHLEGSIHSVSLLAHGPQIRVRLEMKPGQLTHYNLNLDEAAKFLQTYGKLPSASSEVKALKVVKKPVILGTRVYQLDTEKIVAERVVIIKHTEKTAEQVIEMPKRYGAEMGSHKMVSKDHPRGISAIYECIPIKTINRFIGNEFVFLPERGYWPLPSNSVHPNWYELPLKKVFKEDAAADLIAGGYTDYFQCGPVVVNDEIKKSEINESPTLEKIKVHKESKGWFYLDPQYGSEENSISMVDMMRHFRKKQRKYLKSGDVWVEIPNFIKSHDWSLDESGKFLKVDTLGLMRLKAAIGDFDSFVGSKKILEQMRNRLDYTEARDLPSLNETKLELREYQRIGLQWLWWLYRNNLHGLLADEMGLGKTHQAMALMASILKFKKGKKAKFLCIAPTSVLDHWLDKINDFAPNLKPLKHHGPQRIQAFSAFEKNYHVLITSYGVLLRDIRSLTKINWDCIILDEAHFVKNNDTATYRAVCKINAELRLCLTGTPMENHLGELRNIFDFLVPGYLGSMDYFRKNFVDPIDKGDEPDTEIALQKLVQPFKLRRTKENVLKELPSKIEDIRHCQLTSDQIKLYKNILAMKGKDLIKQLKDESTPVPYLHVFATLTLLKQICNHPYMVTKTGSYKDYESGKFELFKELIEEALGSGHKIVVYSQYIEMINIIKDYLNEKNVGHSVLTGQSKNRGQIIKSFQENPDIRVFCGSLLAGGVGIDLTAASVVIHYDRWWNASKENQATDRVHRIGQQKNVQVLKLVTRGTLEEKIDLLIRNKQALFDKFLAKDDELFKSFNRQDLMNLLA